MKQLDLGCGTIPRSNGDYDLFGVDIVDVGLPNVKQADLALESIPYLTDHFDLITAYDFMEHIPLMVYVPPMKKRNCMIELFNEIYRVLKHDGEFRMVSPHFLTAGAVQDPTHLSFWSEGNAHYFSGDYFGMHDHYQHRSKFELLENRVDQGRVNIRMRAIKPDEPPYLVGSVT